MKQEKIISLEDRIPKIKQARRRKANRTLIILLLLFFTLIALIIYFQSPLSHVKEVTVQGNRVYSDNEILKQSGISPTTNVWKINKKTVSKRLMDLEQIKDAHVEIKLFNTVKITVKEYHRIAYVMNERFFSPVLENGTILESEKSNEIPVNALLLFQFNNKTMLKTMIEELQNLPEEILYSISEIHHVPKKMDNYQIVLYMNDGFEVRATLRSFSEKMVHYPAIISQLDRNKKGVIDLEVGTFFKEYQSFKEEDENKIETEG